MKSVFQVLKEKRNAQVKAVLAKKTDKNVHAPAQGEQRVITEQDKAIDLEVNNQQLADKVETDPVTNEQEQVIGKTNSTFVPKNQEVDMSLTTEHLEDGKAPVVVEESQRLRPVNNPEPATQSNEASRLEPVVPDPSSELPRDVAPIVDEYAPTLMGVTNRVSSILPIGALIAGNPVTSGVLLGGAVLAPVVVAGAIAIARKVEQAIEEGQTQVDNVKKEYKNVFHKK
jgi:hypothetical protein